MHNYYEDKDIVISTIVSALSELVHVTREGLAHSLLLPSWVYIMTKIEFHENIYLNLRQPHLRFNVMECMSFILAPTCKFPLLTSYIPSICKDIGSYE